MSFLKSLDVRMRILGLMAGVVALALIWWLGSPLFINNTINEAFPTAAPVVAKPAATQTVNAANKETMAAAETKTGSPVALVSGSFTEVDRIHKGSGKATVYALPDGTRILRFEDFNVTNGPNLFVYLSGHAQPRNTGELHGDGDYDLGRLKGNIGDQNYELPAELDLSKFKSVVIYCKQFSVVFSTAEIAGS